MMSKTLEVFEWQDEVMLPILEGVVDMLEWAIDFRDTAIMHHECDLLAKLPSQLRQRLDWQLGRLLRLEARYQLIEMVDANEDRKARGDGYCAFDGYVARAWRARIATNAPPLPIDAEFLRQLVLEVIL